MSWRSITEAQLWDEINASVLRMDPPQARLWECVKIDPEKWQEARFGNSAGGFWAVAVMGQTVVWYNDIEDGFNCSAYVRYGVIEKYAGDQSNLEVAIQHLLNRL